MSKQQIRAKPVRRPSIDIEKLAAGLLLLAQQLAEEERAKTDEVTPKEPAA